MIVMLPTIHNFWEPVPGSTSFTSDGAPGVTFLEIVGRREGEVKIRYHLMAMTPKTGWVGYVEPKVED